MTTTINTRDFDRIRAFIERETSISLSDEKVYLVETRLAEIIQRHGLADYRELLQRLEESRQSALHDEVIDAMTTNETLWFRDTAPFDAFRDHLLPAYAAEVRDGKRDKIRIWSAACSTGQEPYSLGMVFRDACRRHSALDMKQLEILATDLSDKALARARTATYSGIAMERGLPEDFRERHFARDGSDYTVNREIRERIVFRKFNLQDSFIMMGSFDIILTRYVLIYFQDDFKREVLRKVHGALETGGVLFLGSSESPPAGTAGFSLVRRDRATWYQKLDRAPGAAPALPPPAPGDPATGAADPTPTPAPATPIPSSGSEARSGLDGLQTATEDLGKILERLRELNAKHGQ